MQEGPGRMGGARWGGGGGGAVPSPYPPFSWPIQTLKPTNSDNCQFRYGRHNAPCTCEGSICDDQAK